MSKKPLVKRIVLIVVIIFFTVLELYSVFRVFDDSLVPTTTVNITDQNSEIVQLIKNQYHLNNNIERIVYSPGFPDNYRLEIYDDTGERNEYREDIGTHDDKVLKYFQNIKSDPLPHMKYLIIEIILEICIILVIVFYDIKKKSKKAIFA